MLIGISFDADSTLRRLEADADAVDYLELDATGFFARPSPYLAWLSARHQIIVRAPLLSIGTPGPLNAERLQSLADVSFASNCRFIVHLLGFSESEAIRLGTHVPVSFTETSLGLMAEHVAQATERCGRPALIEPIAAPLRVPGTIGETDFLNRVCRQAGCRLLIDVTTLQVASRNFHFDPHSWLLDIDQDLLAAARITGCSVRNGRWHTDAHTEPNEEAWALMRALTSRARPDLLLLGRQPGSGFDRLRRNLQLLREIEHEARVTSHSNKPVDLKDATPRPSTKPADPRRAARPARDSGAKSIDAAPDASLFVLDDAGVFFSATRQELSLFNTAATLIWCLIEQRLSIQEIIATYQQAYGLDDAESTRHVSGILQQWFGLGYISYPNLLSPPEIPLTTALAQVLTNTRLQEQFRRDRYELADDLRVNREEVDSFVRIDPDELDAQAEEVAQARSSRRRLHSSGLGTLRDSTAVSTETGRPQAQSAGPGRARRYRLLTTTYELRVDSDALDAQLHETLAHLESSEPVPDLEFDLRRSDSDGWMVFNGSVVVERCRRSEEVVPAVKRLLRETSVNRAGVVIRVHAAVVSFQSGCLLMPASAGSGKTTLTAALIRSGATYFSDEVALLEVGELVVRPVPLALTIKEGSVEPLRALYPEIDALTPHLREDYLRVRYLPPPLTSLPAVELSQPVKWIVFPRYDSAAETILRPLARPIAFKRLLDESFVDFDRLDRAQVESVVQGMRSVECFDLAISSLEIAVELVRSLIVGAAR